MKIKGREAQGHETVGGEDCIRVTSPLWSERRMPQVWHDSWRNKDRVLRFTGACVTCQRATFMFDDGDNDPRGILGDHAGSPMRAEDYNSTGDDVPQCFMCANEEPAYRAALDIGRRTWKAKE